MRTYIRSRASGAAYFFTVNLADRHGRPLLIEYIADLRSAFRHVRQAHPFLLDAIVVLPDHLHCIWQLPENDADFSTRWRLIKARFSRSVAQGERISPSRARKGERGIWQRRLWEHTIRDEADYGRHLDYIHYNPVKHGHASSPSEWAYSSFANCVKRGWYPSDWAASDEVRELEFE